MKVFVAIAFVAIIGLTVAELTEEQKNKLAGFKKECVAATPGLDVAVVEKAKQGEFTNDEKLCSFLKCFGEKLDFIKSDGSYNVPVIKEKLAKKISGDPAPHVDKCVEKDQKDGAKNACHLAECLKKTLPNHEGVF